MAKRAAKTASAPRRSADETTSKPPAKNRGKTAAKKTAAKKTAATTPDIADTMAAATASITRALSADDLDAVSQESLRQLMTAVVRAYSAKIQAGEQFLPFQFNSKRVSPTDVMLTCSGLLKAADLQVFELGMWQSFTGR